MHLKNLVRSFPKPPITTQFRANQRAALFAVENLGGNKTGPSKLSIKKHRNKDQVLSTFTGNYLVVGGVVLLTSYLRA